MSEICTRYLRLRAHGGAEARHPSAVSDKTSVGAGGRFLGGLVFGLAERRIADDTLRLALACGAAAVQSIGIAQFRCATVQALLA